MGDDRATKAAELLMDHGFDPAWYEETYKRDLLDLREEGETAADFYLRIGGELGHDPNPRFSEILYRARNMDVRKAIIAGKIKTGYVHWIKYGALEQTRHPFSSTKIDQTREIYLALDQRFLLKTYTWRSTLYMNAADYYFSCVTEHELSPSPAFSEAGYRARHPDVDSAIIQGKLKSGFEHFLLTTGNEARAVISHKQHLKAMADAAVSRKYTATRIALEDNIPGVTALTALTMLDSIEFYSGKVNVRRTPPVGPGGLLVLVPNFLPEILFGGYLAFFGYLRQLAAETGIGLELMLISRSSLEKYEGNLMRMSIKEPKVYNMFNRFQHFDVEKREVDIPENYHVISYCGELHRIALKIAQTADQKPIFFIQEYEADFHANNDMRSFNDSAFLLPHHAVYNSHKLIEFFQKKTAVFDRAGPEYKYTAIENPLQKLGVTKKRYKEMNKGKKVRRFIMYGRPEGHAARNHFAMSVFALRQAILQGVFAEGSWEFYSIGALGEVKDIDLIGEDKLRIMPKISKAAYEEFLQTGDVGMSIITTPHPGIVHFQMAAYGLPTITNKTELRDDAWLASQNQNLVPVEMSPESIIDGFRIAVDRAKNLETRYDNAVNSPAMDEETCLRAALDNLAKIIVT